MANNPEMILLHTCIAAKPPPIGRKSFSPVQPTYCVKLIMYNNYEICFKQLVQSVLDAG